MNRKEAQRQSIIQDKFCMSDDDDFGRSYHYDKGQLKRIICLIISRQQILDHEKDIWKPLSAYNDE